MAKRITYIDQCQVRRAFVIFEHDSNQVSKKKLNSKNFFFRILVMGTVERLGVNIHVDQLMDGIANNCPNLERLELRWDPENLRFSDKSQKAIDILRVKCIKLRCLSLR